MTKAKTVSINIPFPGFYESWYSGAIDSEESQWLEYRTQDHGGDESGPDYESNWPEALRLDDSLGSILNKYTDYSAAWEQIARDYVAAFDYEAGDNFGLDGPQTGTTQQWNGTTWESVTRVVHVPTIGLEFEEMTSPRYYNFETDRLFARVPLKIMREIYRRSRADNHETLAAVIRERFTSYDGFRSHYPNTLADWIAKPLATWDHNEFGTLLLAGLRLAGVDYESDAFRDTQFSRTLGDEGASQIWESAVDWPAFDKARGEERADLFADWIDSDPDGARAWRKGADPEFVDVLTTAAPALLDSDPDGAPLAIRCPLTPDMFGDAGQGAS